MAINRFRQLKQEEKKTLSKALPAEDVETLASTSDSDDDSEEETKDKVKFIFSFFTVHSVGISLAMSSQINLS